MLKIFLPIVIILLALNSYGQGEYDVTKIPAQLIKNANIVKRNEELFIQINNIGSATITTKYVITILNEAGDDAAEFAEWYSKLVAIKNLVGSLYNASGKKIKSLKNGDVSDLSGTSDGTIADDGRVKQHNFNCKIYPYTIAYECTIKYNGILWFPHWQPITTEKMAVEKSVLKVQAPADYVLRYKTFNYKTAPIITTDKDTKLYTWVVNNEEAMQYEQFQPMLYQVTTAVFLAPADFEIQDYKGTMKDWSDFGKFFYNLNLNRDVLPDGIKTKVHVLTDALKTDKEKVKVLYEYLQANTRYVSIQLGIGGWQTFDAKYVSSNGYGDCKALSNYMYALLKEAGIKSYYTLIKAGDNKNYFIEDFPSNQFNHIIVCVPGQKDTTWLECTSQTLAAGYLSGFTSDRPALLVDENGGKLVHTTKYTKDDNVQIRKVQATIDEEGNFIAQVNTKFTALQQDDLHGMINALSKKKTEEYLKEIINLPSYDLINFDYKENKSNLPTIIENISLSAHNYATINGKRLFISPNMFNKNNTKLKNVSTRKYDMELPMGYTDIDTVVLDMPKGYVIESMPDPINWQNKFGTYKATVLQVGTAIHYVRYSQRIGGVYPATDALLLSEYFDKIFKADRVKIVMVKE